MAFNHCRYFHRLLLTGCACLFIAASVFAQADTVDIPEVTVTATRLQGWQPGHEQAVTDSLQLELLKVGNVSELLRQQGSIYVKDYGAGNIATAAIRGTSASHTAVLWNGLPLQDPMLGLTDLSILPLFFFDDARIVLGGGSSLWGSGAIGGAIHLDSRQKPEEGWGFRYQGEGGSFGYLGQGLEFDYGSEGFGSSTRLFLQSAENDYPYQNLLGEERRLPHAGSRQLGLMQENTMRLSEHQKLRLHFWAHSAGRDIPPTRVQARSLARQEDRALRGAADWQWVGAQSSWAARLAAFENQLVYADSLSGTDSDSRTRSLLAEVEQTQQFPGQWDVKSGLQFNYLEARSNVYEGLPRQSRLAAFAALRWHSSSQRWEAVLNGRQEWVDGTATPFTPALSLQYAANNELKAGLTASRNYRLPTFNDQYWPELGNPDLLPEESWNESLYLQGKKKWGPWRALLRLSAFNYNVQNWIIWLPRNGLFTPDNVREVWSRGGSSRLELGRQAGGNRFSLALQYSYTRSTNERSRRPADRSVGRQLIYVPVHQGNALLSWQYKGWYASYYQEWAGRNYTLADNSEWLPLYTLAALRLSRSWQWKGGSGKLYFRLENLWNEDYELIANRPMPGRHFRIGLQAQFNQPLNKQ